MGYFQHKICLFFCFLSAVLLISGCAPESKRTLRICPGRKSISDSASVMQMRFDSAIPFKATGQCRSSFNVEDKEHKENFPVRIWLSPPAKIRLHGDIFFNAHGIDLGCNQNEFWLAIKPKEISTYHWGRWETQTSDSHEIIINPEWLLEAFGMVSIRSYENWSLTNQGLFDVLTRKNDSGVIDKKIYVYCCDYSVAKIEYFDNCDTASVVLKLDKYKKVAEQFSVPTVIDIINVSDNGSEDSFRISLTSVKAGDFPKKLRQRLFSRPENKGFEHIYEIVGDRIIEKSQ